MSGGRDVDVDVALAARARRAAAARGAGAEPEREERALLLLQGEELLLRPHRRVGRGVLQGVRGRRARYERLGRRRLYRGRRVVVVVGQGGASGNRLPILQQKKLYL